MQPALGRAGGIWEMKKPPRLPKSITRKWHRTFMRPIEWAANVHLAVSIPNLLIAETIETPFHDQLIKGSIRVDNGFIPPQPQV